MLNWDNRLLLGIQEIDDEHLELIERTNQLMQSYQNGDPEVEVLGLLEFLREYVVVHFQNEEAFLLKNHYPRYDEHYQIHEDFKKSFQTVYDAIKANGLSFISRIEINHLITDWILNHIGEDDKKWADYLKDLGLV
jgi:hemerythrin